MQQQQTIQTYLQAIEIYNAALRFAPQNWKILKRKARACDQLSQLYSQQQQYQHAIDTLKQAVAGYEMEFSQTLNDALNISYLGMLIERLAELQVSQKQYAQAFDSYQQAISIYEAAIALSVDDSGNHALKAGALTSLADLQLLQSQYTQALSNYQQAVDCYNTSLLLKPLKGVELDRAVTLQKLGNCFCQLSQNSQALECYQSAKKVFIQLPPGNRHLRCLTQQIERLSNTD
ncbi:tetratricopeptide repeat protein [Nostoc sp. CCY 9925]|uniref:tetratricopeptide repeat protein n=1 Tax=Nostoc sp. CCY 9925 TaxID=3103865 RepID=UPI0039C61503